MTDFMYIHFKVMRNSAEKVRLAGNPNVMVCERGTMFGYSKLNVLCVNRIGSVNEHVDIHHFYANRDQNRLKTLDTFFMTPECPHI